MKISVIILKEQVFKLSSLQNERRSRFCSKKSIGEIFRERGCKEVLMKKGMFEIQLGRISIFQMCYHVYEWFKNILHEMGCF